MGASSNKNSDINSSEMPVRNIKKIKRIDPNADLKMPSETEDKNKKKLKELNEIDDFDSNQKNYHEYMFFSVKNGNKAKKNDNLDLLLRTKKKKQKQLYTFTKDGDPRKANELAQILHIQYELDKPKYPYSIKKIKCDRPPVNSDYLVIEYNMNRDEDNESENEEEESDNKSKKSNLLSKKYVLTSRVVHTNNKNCKISNYVYTEKNGERYDYLDYNQDVNQIRKLKMKKDEDNEEKKIKEKEENKEKFINKKKKGVFLCKKMV